MSAKAKPAARPKIAKLTAAQISVAQQPDGSLLWTHVPPAEDVRAGRAGWRPIWCAGFELDAEGKKHYHHLDCIPCHCPPGPQMRMQWCSAREIALLGGRGSAKSEGTFSFLTRGNLFLDLETMKPGFDVANHKPIDISYLNSPEYAFLVLRKNSKDLLSYFKRASRYFAMFGGEMTKEPMGVTFPSGAYGIFDHLADEDAYEKYVGQQFVRIVLEEANQIPEEDRYLKIYGSCRSADPLMQSQIMLTFNPGGPGARWLKSRFIMPGGRRLPFGTPYIEPGTERKRVAIFSSVDDNPYYLASGYDKDLDVYRGSNATLYKQWRLGDFDAQSGQFFEMFRERRLDHEPENAVHCIAPHELPTEWPIAISCDWGYSHPSAVYWAKWSPKKQLHVYREFVVSRMGARELGAEIARRSLDDLAEAASPQICLYLSHDAFHREHEGATEAELVQQGIDSILGAGAAFVFDRSEEERLLDRDVSWEAVKRRAESRRKQTCITIINAGLKRRANLNLIRDYMEWSRSSSESMEFKPAVYINLLEQEGEHAAQEYRNKCERAPSSETLPVLQIHYDGDALDPRNRGCEKLVVSIQSMVEKETNSEEMEKLDGDDPVDSLAYLVGNFHFRHGYVSDQAELRAKIKAIRDRNPGANVGELMPAIERVEYEHKHSRIRGGVNFPRLASPARRQRALRRIAS